MTRSASRWCLLATAALSLACASTRITSMVAPESKSVVYRRVLVLAAIQDLELMQQAELAVRTAASQEERNRAGKLICDPVCREPGEMTEFIPSHTVLFPGRDYTPSELRAALAEHRIDATLVLSPTASGDTEAYVPPTFVTNCSTWGSTTSCASRPIGGGTIKSPWVSFAARLYDARTGAAVWIATSRTNGSALSGTSTLIISMAQQTLRTLLHDRKVM